MSEYCVCERLMDGEMTLIDSDEVMERKFPSEFIFKKFSDGLTLDVWITEEDGEYFLVSTLTHCEAIDIATVKFKITRCPICGRELP